MKTAIHSLFCSMVVILCFGVISAQTQDDSTPPYPPITAENASQLQMIQVLARGTPLAFSWSPDSTRLAITAEGGTWIYDMTDEALPSYYVTGHDLSPRILYAPHHPIYVSYESLYDCEYLDCPYNQKIFVRDITTHEILHEIGSAHGTTMKFSPDGNLLAVATYGNGIRIWETESFLTQNSETSNDFMLCKISTIASPYSVIFSSDSSLITYSGYSPFRASPADHSLWFWDTHTCELKLEIPVLVTTQPMSVPFNADFIDYSRDSHYLVTQFISDYDRHRFYLWDMFSFENLGELSTLFSGSFLTFGFEGNTILFREDGIIKEWDIESKTIVREYLGDNITYLHDGTTLIQRGEEFYRITENGEQPFTGSRYPAQGFSPDNKYRLTHDKDSGSITLLNLETQEEKYVDEYRSSGNNLYWSESENVLVTYGYYEIDSYSAYSVDIWKYNGTAFQRMWGQPSVNAILKALSDDFVIVKTQMGYLEFYGLQTGELVTSIHQDDCIYPAESQSYCDILANASLVNPRDGDTYQNPIARLSDDRHSLEVVDSITNEIVIAYPVPMATNRYSSMWRFDDNGDLLLATASKLYNLTQNVLLVEMHPVESGTRNCDECESTILYYQPSQTWLSSDLNFLISIETEEPIPPISYIRLLVRVWDIQANREIYNLVLDKSASANLAPFGGVFIRFTHDMRWLFEFRFDVPNSGMQKTYERNLNIYNGLTGENVATISTYGANAYDAQFSPDNRFLITSSDTLRIWAVVDDD